MYGTFLSFFSITWEVYHFVDEIDLQIYLWIAYYFGLFAGILIKSDFWFELCK